MFVLITYDVNTATTQGKKRLRKVAKECVNYGHRVQNSVFECEIDCAKWLIVKNKLIDLIDTESDSLRFYYFGDRMKAKIEHIGVDLSLDVTAPLVF